MQSRLHKPCPSGRTTGGCGPSTAAGNASGWSTPRSFIVTILYSPINQSYIFVTKPAISWTAAAGALAYHLQVDDSAAFDLPELDVTRPVSASYTPTVALPYNIYYWRMQVQTASGWSNWTPVYTFTVTPALPVAPMQTSPATASITNDNTPTLNWNSVTNGVTYQVQISTLNTFVTQEQTVVLDPGVLTYTATALPDGIHYWRVRAINYLNVPGAWSMVRSFTVDTLAQAIPAMSAPVNGATVQTTTPTMTVAAVTGSKYYQFQVDDANDFGSTSVDVTITTTTYAIPAAQALPFGTNYWRVRSIDAAGNASGWSTPRSFVVTILYVPVNQAYSLITKPILYWTAAAGALSYHIQVDDSGCIRPSGTGCNQTGIHQLRSNNCITVQHLLLAHAGADSFRVEQLDTGLHIHNHPDTTSCTSSNGSGNSNHYERQHTDTQLEFRDKWGDLPGADQHSKHLSLAGADCSSGPGNSDLHSDHFTGRYPLLAGEGDQLPQRSRRMEPGEVFHRGYGGAWCSYPYISCFRAVHSRYTQIHLAGNHRGSILPVCVCSVSRFFRYYLYVR